MIKKSYIVMFCLIGISVFPDGTESLLGYWVDSYPVPSGMTGYIFIDDGTFIYDNIEKNVNFVGNVGAWSILDSELYISVIYSLTRDSMNPNNIVKKLTNDKNLYFICNMSEVAEFNQNFDEYLTDMKNIKLPFLIMKNIRVDKSEYVDYKYLRSLKYKDLINNNFLVSRIEMFKKLDVVQ